MSKQIGCTENCTLEVELLEQRKNCQEKVSYSFQRKSEHIIRNSLARHEKGNKKRSGNTMHEDGVEIRDGPKLIECFTHVEPGGKSRMAKSGMRV